MNHDHHESRIDRIEEQQADAYEQAFDDAIEEQRREYESDLGPDLSKKYPFKKDWMAAHRVAMKKIRLEE